MTKVGSPLVAFTNFVILEFQPLFRFGKRFAAQYREI